MEQTVLYVIVENVPGRRIHAVCRTAEEAEQMRRQLGTMAQSAESPPVCTAQLSIFAMNAVFPGDRFRLVYGTPKSRPSHPLEVPELEYCRVTNTDAHTEGYAYPDQLYLHRKQALAAAAVHNVRQLERQDGGPLDWAVVVEIGEPLWRRYRSECMVLRGLGWEDTELVRPVRVIHPTPEEATL
jgi:hypothetical protein